MIAFLGTGHLGANFVKALREKGHEVNVWNRTPEKAQALEQDGAKAFTNVADAVKDVERIHLTLKDDASVDEVLMQAEPSLQAGTIIIDHTTTSAQGAIARTVYWAGKGITYLHAPVFMGPQNAREATGYMLVSGSQQVIGQQKPNLSQMTGTVLNLGAETGKAAGMKLVGNLFLLSLTAGITDLLTLAKAQNITPAEVASLFDAWNPGAAMPSRMKRLVTNQFDEPSWELGMARKDAGLMLQAASAAGETLLTIPPLVAKMDKWIENGFGQKDWMIVGKDALPGA